MMAAQVLFEVRFAPPVEVAYVLRAAEQALPARQLPLPNRYWGYGTMQPFRQGMAATSRMATAMAMDWGLKRRVLHLQ